MHRNTIPVMAGFGSTSIELERWERWMQFTLHRLPAMFMATLLVGS
jgi:hypothetical protein